MDSIRKHYITLCMRNNTEVTYIVKNNLIEVTFEQAKYKGFNTLVTDIEGNILECNGFNNSETAYYLKFLDNNRPLIERLAAENA